MKQLVFFFKNSQSTNSEHKLTKPNQVEKDKNICWSYADEASNLRKNRSEPDSAFNSTLEDRLGRIESILLSLNSLPASQPKPQRKKRHKRKRKSKDGRLHFPNYDSLSLNSSAVISPPPSIIDLETPVGDQPLIIGDSMIRDVGKTLPSNSFTVACYPGLNTKKFEQLVNGLDPNSKLKKLVVHIGTNDVKFSRDPDFFIGNLWSSFSTLKVKFPNAVIIISAIITRRDVNFNYIKQLNENLQWMANCFNFRFINANTLVSHCHLSADGLHLNNYGKRVFGMFLRNSLKNLI